MKLSMWMIANRLSSFDLELDIEEKAPAILNSARRAYATNCVHVYREKDYVVCNGEGNLIKIHNMAITQAFEIIQSVFDYFEDWNHQVSQAIDRQDYQEAVSLSWQVFRNPLVLFDGNNKVLGLTSQYGPQDLDHEWAYISQYGYSSLNAVQAMKYEYTNVLFHRHGFQSYKFSGSPLMKYSGIYYGLSYNNLNCGHMNLLARDRTVNEGDYQLLEHLARLLEPSLGQFYHKNHFYHTSVFHNILQGRPYDETALDVQLNYQQWSREDTYHLALIQLTDTDKKQEAKNSLDTLTHTIMLQAGHCVVLKKYPCVLVLANHDLNGDAAVLAFLKDMAANNPVKIGLSLPCSGLGQASNLYKQAKAAIQYGSLADPDAHLYDFFDYALDFMLDATSLYDSVKACLPGIVQLRRLQQSSGDEMLATLKCYLDNERSASRTAAALYTHRNTVLYRIQKIQDILRHSLDDVYVRDYCRMSMRILDLYYRKNS